MEKISLEQYAARHGEGAPPELDNVEAAARAREERQEDNREAAEEKSRIMEELDRGTPPQFILYRALNCIALATHDKDWGDVTAEKLDHIYGDLAQANLLADEEAQAQERLSAQLEEHAQKLRRQLERQLKAQEKITEAIKEGLQALGEV